MLDKHLRPLKEKFLFQTADKISHFLTPNQITVIAFVFGIISCVMVIFSHLYFACLFWILNRIIDGLDGSVARVSNRQSDWGGYLDIMLDFIIYASLPIVFTLCFGSGLLEYTALAVLLGIFYINTASWMYLSAILEKQSAMNIRKELTSVPMPTGLIEGTETIVIFTLFFIFPLHLTLLFFAASGLTLIGIIQRMSWGYINLNKTNKGEDNEG